VKKANFLRQGHLDRLRQNIKPNAARYKEKSEWLDPYFAGDEWFLQSNIDIPDSIALEIPTSKSDLRDLENTKILYEALKHLTPVEASDERLWAYMTHVTFWEYMAQRWPSAQYEGKKRFVENMQEHYFFASDRPRALTRNGISRLWWYGYASYDAERADPFELTAVLLKNLDVTGSILERAFSRNVTVTKAVLSVLLDWEKKGAPFYERDDVRELVKYLVQIGGVTIIDALAYDEIEKIVTNKVTELAAVAA
jgi:hypothetical protein